MGKVIAFRRTPKDDGTADGRRTVPDTAHEVETPPVTVLSAERGIINTGTVHGGQHVTTLELPGYPDGGADHDV